MTLDTDLYKVTMAQAIRSIAPNTKVEYEFINRDKGQNFAPTLAKLQNMLRKMPQDYDIYPPSKEDIDYLASKLFIKAPFLAEFATSRFNPDYIQIDPDNESLKIVGPWSETVYYEVPLLALISELYYEGLYNEQAIEHHWLEGEARLDEKIDLMRDLEQPASHFPFQFMEFGTRRRFSLGWQRKVVSSLVWHKVPGFIGTSNIKLAKDYHVTCHGTMAHEWIMAFQALSPLYRSQKDALDAWANVYRGRLGIALTDTLGLDQFLEDFDLGLAMLFTGVRQDSGDPYAWATRIIEYYNSLGIDPRTKTAVFSDSLDFPNALDIWREFGDKIKCVFGIGTNLTNDMGLDPVNIVIKMTYCNDQPVIKISDSPGKVICKDPEYQAYAMKLFGNKEKINDGR